jgi:hypothetical protein
VISEDDVATINTIAKASRARLEIMVDEGLDFSDIYEINIDELKVLGLIKVDELAAIASMSLQSVRNDFSKNYNHLQMVSKPEGKYLSVAAARTWLKDKNAYTPTKVDGNFFNDSQTVQVQSDSIYVPIAKDGSFFSKECRMSNGYKVGEKGNEQYIESFQDALTQLKDMPLAKWRRPNAKGHYGLVSAVEWGYKPKTK